MAKYTGKNLEFKIDTFTIPPGHLVSVELSLQRGEIEATGAGQLDKEFYPLEREATCTVNVWEDAAGTIRAAFSLSDDAQTISIYPQGNSSGKPVITATAFVTGKPVSVTHNQIVASTYTLRITGAITESTVP